MDSEAPRDNIQRLLLSHTHKVFLEATISTCLWLEPADFVEVFLEWEHEVVHIFSDEDFEYQIASLLEKGFCDIEDGEVEFHRSVLIHTCHACCGWGDIRSNQVKVVKL